MSLEYVSPMAAHISEAYNDGQINDSNLNVAQSSIISTRLNIIASDITDLKNALKYTQDNVDDQVALCEESMQEKVASCENMLR